MGCGGSKAMHVPSGSSDYKYMVEQTWHKVSQTVSKASSKGDLVCKRSGWKTVRVFVSSTFKDFHAEREILVKEVFPDLRQWCEKRRLHLVECDLRWGVPKDTTTDETLRMCLGEIDRCYQDNIMPFFLNLTSERCGWIPTHEDVPESLAREYRWIPGLSVTEMEILHGAYRIDNPNSMFMIRNASFLKKLPPEYEKDFIDPNPIAIHKLEMLKTMLRSKLEDRVKWYNVEYDCVDEDGKVQFSGLQEFFSKEVFEFFKGRIAAQYPLIDASKDPYQQAKEAHESFLKSRSTMVLGRNAILDNIEKYVIEVGQDKSLIITGGAGTGKSSIMARTADIAQTMAMQNKIPGGGDQGWHVFYHFVGAVPGATDMEQCLKRLLKELNQVNDVTMPKNQEATCQMVCSVLSNHKTRPVIVCIDALNQFDDDKSATLLSWLPRKLAPQVRVILAMINDTPPHKSLTERLNKPIELIVTPLDMSARKEIVTELLGTYNKRLDAVQMENLLAKESSQNPLWLAVACEELRVFGLFDRLNDKINSMADGLLELLEQVFTRFEQENGGILLSATLCLLETSATGLLETELLKILGDEDNLLPREKDSETEKDKGGEKKAKDFGPLPAAKWAVIFRALKPFLRPFGDSGEGRLDFYHRALSKAVRQKYFNSEIPSPGSDQLWWHRKLADYFGDSNHIDRKVEELPVHLLKLEEKECLTTFLTNWDVFDRLYNEDYSTLLLKYWREGHGKGWQTMMGNNYRESLAKLIVDDGTSQETVALRYEQIARVVNQSGENDAAFSLLEKSMDIEQELGSKEDRMVELYALACTIYDDKLKLMEYVDASQITYLRPVISYARKSIAIRETLEGDVHKYKLGKIKIQLAFNLQAWLECGGDNTLNSEEAAEEGREQVRSAIEIFKELDDVGHIADAVMTKGVLEERGSVEQKKYYLEAVDLCLQAYGEYSVLSSRLFLNVGIMFEDMRQYEQAYDYYIRWQDVCEQVFGYHHPRTQRCRNCLNEATYRRIQKTRAAKSNGPQDRNLIEEHDVEQGSEDSGDDEYEEEDEDAPYDVDEDINNYDDR